MSSTELFFANTAGWAPIASFWLFVLSTARTRWRDALQQAGVWVMILGFVAASGAIVARTVASGHLPFANLYETLMWCSWGLMGGFLLADRRYQIKESAWLVSLVAASIFIYASWLPEQQQVIRPLAPALLSYWRQIHVPPLIFSYALFFLSAITAVLQLWFARTRTDLACKYSEATIGAIRIGFPLLTIGIITGALWANHAWGTYWSWDPKETLAFVTWLTYSAFIHVCGKLSREKLSVFAIAAALVTLLTYVGFNLLGLGGLHSYGAVTTNFSSKPFNSFFISV